MAVPRTYSITLASLLSFPLRICNPPPAVGKVRSCGVTPLLSVSLDDILDRQHLPPLGLKDFEEWLLFVEICPENLYFILWLREYKQRYSQWQSQAAFNRSIDPAPTPTPPSPASSSSSSAHAHAHSHSPAHYSSHLAIFYLRAKQTFFTPGSAYELNLDSALLAPLHRPGCAPYPPPSALRAIESEVRAALDASLRRFVGAQLNNVGSRRVLCGILAGIAFCLLGACVPLALVFAARAHRWTRLAALPGLWLGLTVLLASVNGICLGVYIFGDLRQLRRFELARPRISKPVPLPAFSPIARLAGPGAAAHGTRATAKPGVETPCDAGRAAVVGERAESACGSSEEDGIHISPAYFDAEAAAEDDHSELYRAPWDADLDADAHHRDRDREHYRGADAWKTDAWREEVDYGAEYGLDLSPLGDAASGYSCSRSRTPSRASSRGAPGQGDGDAPSSPRSVASASSLSGASEASGESIGGMTVFSGTATFIHAFDPAPAPGTAALPTSAVVAAAVESGAVLPMHLNHLGASGIGGSTDEIDTDAALARAMRAPASHQRVAPFDFEGLPVKKATGRPHHHHHHQLTHQDQQDGCSGTNNNNNDDTKKKNKKTNKRRLSLPPLSIPNPLSRPALPPLSISIPQRPAPTDVRATHRAPRPPSPAYAARPRGWRGALGRMQERCGLARWRLQVGYLEEVKYVGRRNGGWKEEVEAASPKPHWSSPYWEAVGREKGVRGVGAGVVGGGVRGDGDERRGEERREKEREVVGGAGDSERYIERSRGWAGWAPRGSWGRKSADSEKTRYVGEEGDDEDQDEEEGGWGVDVEKGVKGKRGGKHHHHHHHNSQYSQHEKTAQHASAGNRHSTTDKHHAPETQHSTQPQSAEKPYSTQTAEKPHSTQHATAETQHATTETEKQHATAEKETRFRRRLRAMQSVPAFAVPLARVLSPVVVRGQWEIVVRSAVYAAVVSVCVIGAMVGMPV